MSVDNIHALFVYAHNVSKKDMNMLQHKTCKLFGLLLLFFVSSLKINALDKRVVIPHPISQLGLPVGIIQGEEDEYEVVSFTIQQDSFSYSLYEKVSNYAYHQYALIHKWKGILNGKQYQSRKLFFADLQASEEINEIVEQYIYRTDAELLSTLEYNGDKIELTNKKVNHSTIVYKFRDLKDWFTSLWVFIIIK